MKRYIFCLLFMLLSLECTDVSSVGAYSVTVQKDGMYAEVIPDSYVNNVAAIFKKNVQKAMKYYNKYKDADDYTYITKVPDKYRDFIPVAKKIHDSDKIIIRNPFYLYQAGDNISGDDAYEYYFFAEKNGKKLCLFSIYVDGNTRKISFWYDKMMDRYFVYDEKAMGDALFYEIDETTYAETPKEINIVRNQKVSGTKQMIRVGGTDWEAIAKEFEKKNYSEKKDEIFGYLAKAKKKRVIKKAEKNLKLELKDEYVASEKDAEENSKTGVYIVIGIVVVGVITGGSIFIKRRKKE